MAYHSIDFSTELPFQVNLLQCSEFPIKRQTIGSASSTKSTPRRPFCCAWSIYRCRVSRWPWTTRLSWIPGINLLQPLSFQTRGFRCEASIFIAPIQTRPNIGMTWKKTHGHFLLPHTSSPLDGSAKNTIYYYFYLQGTQFIVSGSILFLHTNSHL